MVRQRISDKSINAAGWRSLVSSGTRAIIEDRKLYGFKPDKPGKLDIPEDFKDLNTGNSDYSLSFIQYIESVVRDTLSTERFLHSRNTALHASDLCRRFGLDPKAGYLAGITHDFAKQLDSKQMLKIVKNAGLEISAIEKNKTNLLHGKAATVLLRERFCIHNKDVLEAVACHTYGSDDMGPLAKIIYIADKTENSRNIDPALRKMCLTASSEADLDNILYTVLKKTVNKLQERKLDLSESTIKLLKKMKQAEI
jgi:nicotinate-nucleotide adenylyltransferase